MKHAPSFRRNPILGRIIPLASPISQRRLREGRRRLHMRWRVVYRGRTRPARCGIGRRPAIAAALGPKSLPWQSLTHHTVYLGLHWLSAWQSADLYEPLFNRYGVFSFVITSNQDVEEGLGLLVGPISGNSALDRPANVRDQIVIEGTSYRERLLPHRSCGVWPGFSIVHRHSSRSGNPEP